MGLETSGSYDHDVVGQHLDDQIGFVLSSRILVEAFQNFSVSAHEFYLQADPLT
jgi:hypothetical protein